MVKIFIVRVALALDSQNWEKDETIRYLRTAMKGESKVQSESLLAATYINLRQTAQKT
jgi:hypothetical protein